MFYKVIKLTLILFFGLSLCPEQKGLQSSFSGSFLSPQSTWSEPYRPVPLVNLQTVVDRLLQERVSMIPDSWNRDLSVLKHRISIYKIRYPFLKNRSDLLILGLDLFVGFEQRTASNLRKNLNRFDRLVEIGNDAFVVKRLLDVKEYFGTDFSNDLYKIDSLVTFIEVAQNYEDIRFDIALKRLKEHFKREKRYKGIGLFEFFSNSHFNQKLFFEVLRFFKNEDYFTSWKVPMEWFISELSFTYFTPQELMMLSIFNVELLLKMTRDGEKEAFFVEAFETFANLSPGDVYSTSLTSDREVFKKAAQKYGYQLLFRFLGIKHGHLHYELHNLEIFLEQYKKFQGRFGSRGTFDIFNQFLAPPPVEHFI